MAYYIRYDKDTGILCDRMPAMHPITPNCIETEVDEETYKNTLCVPYGQCWAYKDGKLAIIDDSDFQSTDEYKAHLRERELEDASSYLKDTQPVIDEMNEALATKDQSRYEYLCSAYKDVLAKRQEYRKILKEAGRYEIRP